METTRSARLLRIAREALAKRAEAAGQEGAEAGFTLIELMVVLLIMAILLAIAIPTFLGVKGGAQDRAVQSNLTNALTSAKSVYANQGTYPAVATLLGTLSTQEPELAFITTAAAKGTNQISTAVSADGNQLVLVAESNTGTCWVVSDNDGTLAADDLGNAPTGTAYGEWNGATTCSAANFVAATIPTSWTAPTTNATGWTLSYPTAAPAAF